MTTLKRDDILKVNDIKIEPVDVPEWGGQVFVKTMGADERDALEDQINKHRTKEGAVDLVGLRALTAVYSICDENGKLLFTIKDVEMLGKKSGAAMQRVFAKSQEISKIGDNAVKELAEGLSENPLEGSPLS